MNQSILRAAIIAILTAMLLGQSFLAKAQRATQIFGASGIPRTNERGPSVAQGTPYKTWSLFLPCSASWLVPERKVDLDRLLNSYMSFADVSGARHAAAWFMKMPSQTGGDKSIHDLNYERSTFYCQKFGLVPSDGPFVIVTTTHPDDWAPENKAEDKPADPLLVLSFKNVGPEKAADLLDRLNNQLYANKLSQTTIDAERFYLAWQQALTSLCAYLNDLKVSISLKVLSIEKTSICK